MSELYTELHIGDMLRASHVNRWSMVHVDRQQTLAEHNYNVAAIAVELCRRIGEDKLIGEVLAYALIHDAFEVVTGDIPTPMKCHLSKTVRNADETVTFADMAKYDYSPVIRQIVKHADTIEALLYLQYHGVGNHAAQVRNNMINTLKEDSEVAHQLFWDILKHEPRVLTDFVDEI